MSNSPADKTATWIWLESGQLKVEFYDFRELAQRIFGNDIAYIWTVHEMPRLFLLTEQGEASSIKWMTENFKSYFDIKGLLEENEVAFSVETESWA